MTIFRSIALWLASVWAGPDWVAPPTIDVGSAVFVVINDRRVKGTVLAVDQVGHHYLVMTPDVVFDISKSEWYPFSEVGAA